MEAGVRGDSGARASLDEVIWGFNVVVCSCAVISPGISLVLRLDLYMEHLLKLARVIRLVFSGSVSREVLTLCAGWLFGFAASSRGSHSYPCRFLSCLEHLDPSSSAHGNPQVAYTNHPVQDVHIHLSAPFIYAEALEELCPRPGMSFLNIVRGLGEFGGRRSAGHTVEAGGSVKGLDYFRRTTAFVLSSWA